MLTDNSEQFQTPFHRVNGVKLLLDFIDDNQIVNKYDFNDQTQHKDDDYDN